MSDNKFKPKTITYHLSSGDSLTRTIDDQDEWDKAVMQASHMSPPGLKFVDGESGNNIVANIKNVEFISWENGDES